MDEDKHSIKDYRFILHSSTGAPYQFTIKIKKDFQDSGYTFIINGIDFDSNLITKEYQLNLSDHHSYLDFFEKLSLIFNLRLPHNRKKTNFESSDLNFNEVLLENLNEDILYGYGDPSVLLVSHNKQNSYYGLFTTNDAPHSFPILKSKDLISWEFVDFVFPKGRKPEWAADGKSSDYWAPEMHQVGKEFRVYFVARHIDTLELCIGMARSSSPEGPFSLEKEPTLKGNVIDPHIYVKDDSTTYLIWKEDRNDIWPLALIKILSDYPYLIAEIFKDKEDQATASFITTLWPWLNKIGPMERFLTIQVFIEAVASRFNEVYNLLRALIKNASLKLKEQLQYVVNNMKTPVYIQKLSIDGLNLIGVRRRILENDLEWEAHLVEGMWLTHQQNKYFLFYAGNDFSTDQYGIGVAISDALLGPYIKMPKPLLQSTSRWRAPGHPSITIRPNEYPIMFLHAFFPGKAAYKQFRALLSVSLRFEGDNVILGS